MNSIFKGLSTLFTDEKRFLLREHKPRNWVRSLFLNVILPILLYSIWLIDKDYFTYAVCSLFLVIWGYIVYELFTSSTVLEDNEVRVFSRNDRKNHILNGFFFLLALAASYATIENLIDNREFNLGYLVASIFFVGITIMLFMNFLNNEVPTGRIFVDGNNLKFSVSTIVYYTAIADLYALRISRDTISMKSTEGLVDRLHGYSMTRVQINELITFMHKHVPQVEVEIMDDYAN